MHRVVALLGLVGCSFSPAALPAGGDDAPAADAPVTPADAPAADAPAADAPVTMPDAPAGPDAPPDPCPGPLGTLELGTPVTGSVSGASSYTPTCGTAGGSGGEDFYRLATPGMTDTDLVFDMTEAAGLGGIVDVTSACEGGPDGVGFCSGVGAPGAGEVVVVPFAAGGTRFVAVDSVAGTGGGYTLTAFLRAVVSRNAACDPELLASRCALGSFCIDKNNDGTTTCEAMSATVDANTGGLAIACDQPPELMDDAAILGSLASPTEVDVFELSPAHDRKLRVVVDDGVKGGCSADTVLEVVTGASCQAAATVVASDDNSGLGPCPRLENVQLQGGAHAWLRIHLASGAPVTSASYAMVVDFY